MGDSNSVVAEYVSEEKLEKLTQQTRKKFNNRLKKSIYKINIKVDFLYLDEEITHWLFSHNEIKKIILVRYIYSWINNKLII